MPGANSKIRWPDGKDFAFTIFDDTDFSTVENAGPIYQLLTDLGFRTTKSVWPLPGDSLKFDGKFQGSTCDDPEYTEWVTGLQRDGVEIALHSVTYSRSTREQVIQGFDTFSDLFGGDPKSLAQHSGREGGESIYWGDKRLSGVNALFYNAITRSRHKGIYQGHVEGDESFWGDISQQRLQYVRNFVFPGINTLKACPQMPYHDPQRPYVNYWFASSEGANKSSFNECINEAAQDALEEEGGACIMYTHFANSFMKDGRIDARFQSLMERLSKKNGWFVPVSELLDFLLTQDGSHTITKRQRSSLERRWLLHKFRVGTT